MALAAWVILILLLIFTYPVSKWLFFGLFAAWLVGWFFLFKKIKHKTWFFGVLIVLLLSGWGILHLDPVQNWLVGKLSSRLSKELKTTVTVRHVDFSLFSKMLVEGVLVEDRKKDTLLYAGTLKVNISDWFFLKDKPVLKYIGLKDAVINMNRSDSVWNYQFLVDYFSSPKSSGSKKESPQIDLKEIELENIRFNRVDKWAGQNMIASIRKLSLSADKIDLAGKKIDINHIDIDQPVFALQDYRGNRPPRTTASVTSPETAAEGQLQWNREGWIVQAANIRITNGTFSNDKETDRPPYTDQFDGLHLRFGSINASMSHILFSKDTIALNIQLAAKEKSGFEVTKLASKMKITPSMMEFSELDIQTPRSRVGNYYAMRYDHFNADMSDFIHSVMLEGNFENSSIHSDDIAYFAPQLKTWNRVLNFSGRARGKIDNLSVRNMNIQSGNTAVTGSITLRGLPDIENTFIDFKSDELRTNYTDLVTLVPYLKKIRQPQLSQLGSIRFKGNFTGFIKDFVAYGNVSTGLGAVNADINMKLRNVNVPTYSGKLSSAGFNLGRFFNNKDLGNIAFSGQVKGKGFDLDDLNADFNGTVNKLDYSGYTYQNITLNGTFVKNLFSGHLDMNDPNLKISDLEGSVSLLGDKTEFNFSALLEKANLRQLHYTRENFSLAGNLNLNFAGNNIDDFLGTAKVYNASLWHDSTRLSFDSLIVRSLLVDEKKMLTVQTNELEGNITGDFKVLELPEAFKVFLNRYYPAYIEEPKQGISNQDFSFYIKTRQVDDYVKLLDKRLSGFNNSTFSGNLKLAANEMNVNASIPDFTYDGKRFTNLDLVSKGTLDSLNATISVTDIALSDSLHIPNTRLILGAKNDLTHVQLTTSASKTVSEARLNANIKTLSDGVRIHLFPSSFILNDKKWNLEKDGEITLRKSYIEAKDVRFTQGEQEIVIDTEPDDESNRIDLVAKLRKVNINDFTPLFMNKPRLEGIITGKVKLKDPFGKQIVEYDAVAEKVRVDNKEIGDVTMKGDVNTSTGLVTIDAGITGDKNKARIKGSLNYKDTTNNQLDIAFTSERFDISILDNYMGSIFSEMQGNAISDLKVTGGNDHRYITGSVAVEGGSFRVKYTQCKYKFDNETIIFNPDEIDLGTIQLKDTLNNSGTASGKIRHNMFDEFGFDNMRFQTSKMLLLNTSKKDNSSFYGKVIGRATMTLDGPTNDMRIDIDGEPSRSDSSHVYIPTGSSQETGAIDYIVFTQFGSKMEDEFKGKKETNFLLNMDITANPACKVDVILDETLGDVIKGKGNGKLNIKVGSKESTSMRGSFTITEGQYTYNFQSILKKYFSVTPGSSIIWNGDPYLAQINIDAEYTAKDIDLKNISPSLRQKGDLTIIAHLKGVLNKPDINFDFALSKKIQPDFIAEKKLEDLKNDKNEQLKQVASLLLLNTFTTDNSSFLTGDNTLGVAANTIGQILSNALTSTFSKFLQKALNDNTISTYFDVNSSLDLKNSASQLQGAVKLGLIKTYFNNRLIISVGGNLDFNNPYLANTNLLLTPDFTAEWLLSKDGKLRIVGFRKTNIDYTYGQRNRQGVSLTYKSDFDRFSELFGPSEEKRRKRLAGKLQEDNNPPPGHNN